MSRLLSLQYILVVCGKIIIEIKKTIAAWTKNRPFCYRVVSKSKGRFACKIFRNIDDIISKYASGVPPSRMRNHHYMLKGCLRPFAISVMAPPSDRLDPWTLMLEHRNMLGICVHPKVDFALRLMAFACFCSTPFCGPLRKRYTGDKIQESCDVFSIKNVEFKQILLGAHWAERPRPRFLRGFGRAWISDTISTPKR